MLAGPLAAPRFDLPAPPILLLGLDPACAVLRGFCDGSADVISGALKKLRPSPSEEA